MTPNTLRSKSIAVLPFANQSGAVEQEYFCDGMTEEIIKALSRIQGLKVTSRTSSFYFKDQNIPIPEIGRLLSVSTILEGSIRLAGNQVRISAQLIDVAEDYSFWSQSFDRSLDNIFAVQDEVSLLIADQLREHLGHFELKDQLVADPAVPVAHYQKYLRGRYHILKMGKSDIEVGMQILEDIIAEQEDFALAHLSLHLAYTLLGTIGLMPAQEAFTLGQKYLDRAIELDRTLPEVQLNLSYLAFLQEWNFPKGYEHLQEAFKIRPQVEYYQSMASMLVAEAKYVAALNYIQTALEIDPFSAINHHLQGFILYCQEKYPEALERFQQALELKSDFMASRLYLGQTLILLDRAEESLRFFEGLAEDGPGEVLKLSGRTMALAVLKGEEEIAAEIATLEAKRNTELLERATTLLINIYTLLGKKKEALNLIDIGVQYRLPMMIYLAVDPLLKPLRKEARFQTLLQMILGKKSDRYFFPRKYKKSLLDEDLLESYKAKLKNLMEKEQAFFDPQLTLRSLATMMEIPPNHLSQLLNEGFNQNFSEFVNAYRLEAFQQKVADPQYRHLTILALAFDSGFNSKTVFNTFFKKKMSQTPRAYCRSIWNS